MAEKVIRVGPLLAMSFASQSPKSVVPIAIPRSVLQRAEHLYQCMSLLWGSGIKDSSAS